MSLPSRVGREVDQRARRDHAMARSRTAFRGWFLVLLSLFASLWASSSFAWFDETHLAIAKAAGYRKWYNATGADMAKIKAGALEAHNHFVNNPRGTEVTPQMVLDQVARYDTTDPRGHLYGAILASLRNYIREESAGKYGEYHLAFCANYVGDPSMPLHNMVYNAFNRRHDTTIDGTINEGVLENLDAIQIYPITIRSEADLANEIARIAILSMALGYTLEEQDRLLTREEAYVRIGHSASLLKAILEYAEREIPR